ncbi:MAG: RNB domain-containing ribonuclease [Proteobacteria bacterium]|nr:RNB domain-containing ribonuclease [Pseudomonadota bacterium]
MYALFEDAGKYHAGRLMSEGDSSCQIELESGRRVKIKAANVLLRFAAPAPAELIAQAQLLAQQIDLDLAWEFAPEDDFGFGDLARDYFDAAAGAAHQAAALLRLFDAPHYFRRLGKGRFKKAPQETVQAALAAIERKQQQAALVAQWADELAAGRCPEPVAGQLYRVLFKPDKNGPEYKAVVEASRRAQLAPLALLQRAGAIRNPYQFHWRRFLFDAFPAGTGFPAQDVPPLPDELPTAPVQAFSVDDSATTEIDDALSVQGLGSGTVTLGVHIAAPGLAIQPGSTLDRIARERLSTVYMPGWKITMLPDAVVQAYTLDAGRDCPAVSLYLTLDEATLQVRASQTRLERVPVATNLRHDRLDGVITEAALAGQAPAEFPHAAELAFCWRLARELKARREQVRGKPETFTRPDYDFRLDNAGAEPSGDEQVSIAPRQRGAPLDLIVSEAMILANSTWGKWLADLGVPGIYRSQASLAPGIKVRMGTKPLPHAGMGVAQYTWATSPLRRYVDLVNQWQLIACARHGRTAALAAPFKPKDASLFSVISAFDAAYTGYGDFQRDIERYWTLRWLQQQGVGELEAAVIKDGLVRAQTLPLVFRVPGSEGFARGTRLKARIAAIDLLTLELHATLLARLEDGAAAAEPGSEPEDDSEAAEAAGAALRLAIDVEEAPAADAAAEPAAPAGAG